MVRPSAMGPFILPWGLPHDHPWELDSFRPKGKISRSSTGGGLLSKVLPKPMGRPIHPNAWNGWMELRNEGN